jgi:hypothetical protein
MKNIKTIAVVSALGLAVCSSAIAQGRPGGGKGHGPAGAQQPPKDAAAAVAHIAEAYPMIAPFDATTEGPRIGVENYASAERQTFLSRAMEAVQGACR